MRITLFSLLVSLAFSVVVFAQTVPTAMTYQGRLTDSNGANLPDGTGYEVEVRLWSAPTGGTEPLWAVQYGNIPVKNGAFSLVLGSGGTILGTPRTLAEVFATNSSVHLGLTFTKLANGNPPATISEILPRQQLLTTPYAFRAASVQPDGVNSAAIQDGSIQSTDLAAALKAQLDQLVPSGSVMAFAGATAPAGWLKCDGTAVSRTQYPALFAAIATAHGNGDGSTTFHLPDYRGRFLRGVSETSNTDPDTTTRTAMAPGGATGNNVGSVQTDELKSHTHDHKFSNPPNGSSLGSGNAPSRVNRADDPVNSGRLPSEPTGGSETRPKNAYVIYIIKQ